MPRKKKTETAPVAEVKAEVVTEAVNGYKILSYSKPQVYQQPVEAHY